MAIATTETGMKVITFGSGDVCIQDTKSTDGAIFNGLCFFETEPRSIDSTTQEFVGKTTDEVKAQVHFVFEKKESIRALVNSLEVIYDHMSENGR